MKFVNSLWIALSILLLFGCMIIIILGVIFIVNVEIREITGIDVAKEVVERKWKSYTH